MLNANNNLSNLGPVHSSSKDLRIGTSFHHHPKDCDSRVLVVGFFGSPDLDGWVMIESDAARGLDVLTFLEEEEEGTCRKERAVLAERVDEGALEDEGIAFFSGIGFLLLGLSVLRRRESRYLMRAFRKDRTSEGCLVGNMGSICRCIY